MKRIIKFAINYLNMKSYNRNHKTDIRSVYASLNANYGKNVIIDRGTRISDDVKIGDYSYVNTNSSIENSDIGKYCSISSGVYICPAEHHTQFRTTSPYIIRNGDKRNKCIIGNDVLISLNVIVLEGVKIGDGAVIAAGAVVTKDVQPYEIVGGIPAKHLKWRFSEEERKDLMSLKWWDNPLDRNLFNIDYFKVNSNVYVK